MSYETYRRQASTMCPITELSVGPAEQVDYVNNANKFYHNLFNNTYYLVNY